MQLLEDEKNRQQRYGIHFGLLLVQPVDMTDPLLSIKMMAERVAQKMRSTDRIGRLDREHLLIVLTSCDPSAVAIARTRLIDNDMRVLNIEISPGENIQEQLDIARTQLKNYDRLS